MIFGVPYDDEPLCTEFHAKVDQYFLTLPARFRNDKTQIAFVSGYIKAPWQNAEEVNLVSHVEDPNEFVDIITARIWEMCIQSPKLMRHPEFMFVSSHFEKREFDKAIAMWTASFLIDPKQHGLLRDIAAALTEMGDEQTAGYLVNEAARLREQLKEVGAIYVTRDGWPVPDSQNVMKWFLEIETNGLPENWEFQRLLECVRNLKAQYA